MNSTFKIRDDVSAKLGGLQTVAEVAQPTKDVTKTSVPKSKSEMTKMAKGLSGDSDFVSNALDSALSIYAGYTLQAPPKQSDNKLPETIPAYTPYENLNGISDVLPVIIAAVDFMPTKDTDGTVSETGSFIRQQQDLRKIRENCIEVLLSKSDKKYSSDGEKERAGYSTQTIDIRTKGVLSEISAHKNVVNSLYDFINAIDTLDDLLDLRSSSWGTWIGVKPTEFLKAYGFSKANLFSSSKVWSQIVLNTKETVRTNSGFLQRDFVSDNDADPITTSGISDKRFYFPLNGSILPLSKIDELKLSTELTQLTNDVRGIYSSFYENTLISNNESRICVLANALSREYAISGRLVKDDVIAGLKTQFSYNVSQTGGNQVVLDTLFGKFGNKVTQFVNDETTLVGASHAFSGDSGVLVFESSYIEDGTSTITPGTTHYVDRHLLSNETFQTNVSNLKASLDSLVNKLSTSNNRLNFIRGFLVERLKTAAEANKDVSWDVAIDDPASLLNKLSRIFLNDSKLIKNDLVEDGAASLFKFASTNVDFKARLFLYVIMLTRKNSNPSLLDFLLKDMFKILKNNLSSSDSLKLKGASWHRLSESNIKSLLSIDKPLFSSIADALTGINGSFIKNQAFGLTTKTTGVSSDTVVASSETTLFGGQVNTVIMMLAFDLLVQYVANFTNREMVSYVDSTTGTVYVAVDKTVNGSESFRLISEKISNEVKLLQDSFATLKGVFDNITGFIIINFNDAFFQKFVSTVKTNSNVGSSLFGRQQVDMYAERVFMCDRIMHSSEGVIKFLDESQVPDNLFNALNSFLTTPEYLFDKAFNKKILTVGLPLGFTKNLKKRIPKDRLLSSESYGKKQYDIITLNVYKVDGNTPDIIWKPVKFPFEISRFPARLAGNPVISSNTLSEILAAFPTYDFGEKDDFSWDRRPLEQFYPKVPAGSLNAKLAFDTPDYGFLDGATKLQLHNNHVTSYLLEVYMRLLTGLPVSEQYYYPANTLGLEQTYREILTRAVLGLIADPRGSTDKPLPTLEAALNSIPDKSSAAAEHALNLVSDLSHTLSSVSGVALMREKLSATRRFDRVFNMVIDPDDFEVDVDQTRNYDNGALSLSMLLNAGEIIKVGERLYGKQRSINQNDIIHERYYVTFETLAATGAY